MSQRVSTKRDQPADHRHQGHDRETARRYDHARQRRGVAQQILRQQRDHRGAAKQHEAQHEHEDESGGEIAVLEQGQVDDRIVPLKLIQDEGDEPGDRGDRGRQNEVRPEPVFLLALVENHLQEAKPEDKEGEAEVVETDAPAQQRVALLDQMRRVFNHRADQRKQDDADRDVDQKDPVPGEVVGDPAAQGRADRRSEDDGDAVEGEGHAAVTRRESVGENGLRHRLQPAAGQALQGAKGDEQPEARRQPAEQRGHTEAGDAGHVEPLAAEDAGQPAADRQDDRVGNQVRGQDPGRLFLARRQAAGDVLQRDVGDGDVEHLHERGHGDDGRDDPGRPLAALTAAGPLAATRSARRCPVAQRPALSLVSAAETSTFGITDMPSPRTMPGAGGSAKTILTGTRWTILT